MNYKRYVQWVINVMALYMFIAWVVVPFASDFLPYYDETIPDETIYLDEEITEVLANMEPTFEDLYFNPLTNYDYTLSYQTATRTPLTNQDNFAQSVESIVYITTEDADGEQYLGTGSILTPDGLIMTNFHVIVGSAKVVVTTADGVHYPVTGVVASNEVLDITFMTIDALELTPITIGDSDTVAIGDEVLVIGHAEGLLNTLSVGNVSGIRSYTSQGIDSFIQITNSISSGNSGGAVLNQYGEIIGIPTWSVEYDDNIVQVQNLNFAVPINAALEVLQNNYYNASVEK